MKYKVCLCALPSYQVVQGWVAPVKCTGTREARETALFEKAESQCGSTGPSQEEIFSQHTHLQLQQQLLDAAFQHGKPFLCGSMLAPLLVQLFVQIQCLILQLLDELVIPQGWLRLPYPQGGQGGRWVHHSVHRVSQQFVCIVLAIQLLVFPLQ